MAQVISFERYRPVARYDATPWTEVRIEESDSSTLSDDSVWTELETIALSPVDSDPENPAYRDFTTELASDDPDLWYRIVFVDGSGDESLPTVPVQNTTDDASAYATVAELARILKIGSPSAAQTLAMERCLLAASGEINSEIDLDADGSLSGWQVALAEQVCLERAAELWKLQEVQFGIVGLGSEFGPTHMARNTWDKHAYTLAPLKAQWGFA